MLSKIPPGLLPDFFLQFRLSTEGLQRASQRLDIIGRKKNAGLARLGTRSTMVISKVLSCYLACGRLK